MGLLSTKSSPTRGLVMLKAPPVVTLVPSGPMSVPTFSFIESERQTKRKRYCGSVLLAMIISLLESDPRSPVEFPLKTCIPAPVDVYR